MKKPASAINKETSESVATARREFLKFLAASPYVAALGGVAAFLEQSGLAHAQTTPGLVGPLAPGVPAEVLNRALIQNPKEALDVFDFEEVARHNVNPGHWWYMASGVDDDGTLRANREIFQHVELRPRRLRDATKVDMRVELFGATYASPIFLCPTGGEKSFNLGGEADVARAAKARNTLQILSTVTSTPVEEVNAARGIPVWQQLYAPNRWDACQKILERVAAAGCPVIALTVDNTTGRNSESFLRWRPKDTQQCTTCHASATGPSLAERPMYKGIDTKGLTNTDPSMDWDYVDKIRQTWKGKFLIKGIDTREDAALAVQHGIDGVLVSNHGGRATETLRPTLEALPEVVAAVGGRIPVFVDGGFRRGTDVFKGLALGAKAVGIGRPMLWGLGAFGQAGVDRVIEIMQGELKLCMGNCGTRTVADITPEYVETPDWRALPDLSSFKR